GRIVLAVVEARPTEPVPRGREGRIDLDRLGELLLGGIEVALLPQLPPFGVQLPCLLNLRIPRRRRRRRAHQQDQNDTRDHDDTSQTQDGYRDRAFSPATLVLTER